jgi:hypothetical protein
LSYHSLADIITGLRVAISQLAMGNVP